MKKRHILFSLVKIWEIRCPLDIKSDPKYLATQQKGDPLGRKR